MGVDGTASYTPGESQHWDLSEVTEPIETKKAGTSSGPDERFFANDFENPTISGPTDQLVAEGKIPPCPTEAPTSEPSS